MDNKYAIEINNLHKSYGKVEALRGVNISVEQGELFGFLGPNGAGKTTTIRCMLDLLRLQSGSIRLFGLDPQADPKKVKAHVGYLPGELNIEPNLKVNSALRYFVELRGNQVNWDYALQLAHQLELDLDVPIKNLSKGNKQKVGLVQAMMHKPELLLMDEPTSGLDPLMQQKVYRMLRDAKTRGATIFFSSHIINEVEHLADRIAIINQGVIVEESEPGKLINMEVHRMQIRFKAPVDTTSLERVEGVTLLQKSNGTLINLRVEGDLNGVIKELGKYPVNDIDLQRQSLEEAFLSYYQNLEQETN